MRVGLFFFLAMAGITGLLAQILSQRLVTREMLYQTRLAHQERMAGIGNLAAGVAHEIGNPLASISSALQMQLRKRSGEEAREIEMLLGEIDRIHRSVRNLARLTRAPGARRRPLLLQDVVRRAVSLLRYDPRAREVTWVETIDGDTPPFLADEDAWLQVCLNLLVNSLDALAGRDDRRIEVSVGHTTHALLLEVKDNGAGMPESVLRRALDPLYTTKPPGQGTGLGLAFVQRVVRRHGGQVRIESEAGHYTLVTIEVPKDNADR